MAVAVAGLWELGHNVPLQEAHLWGTMLRDFEVEAWHMSPVTGIAERRVEEWPEPERMIEALREQYDLVFVTEDSSVPELQHFEHPENSCYVFGKANYSPFIALRQHETDLALHIHTPAGKGLLWPHQCAVAVLWHRGLQWQ